MTEIWGGDVIKSLLSNGNEVTEQDVKGGVLQNFGVQYDGGTSASSVH